MRVEGLPVRRVLGGECGHEICQRILLEGEKHRQIVEVHVAQTQLPRHGDAAAHALNHLLRMNFEKGPTPSQ